MKNSSERFALKVTVVALQGALGAMLLVPGVSQAEGPSNPEVAALTVPESTAEIGINTVRNGTDKFGEYTGLTRPDSTLVGNVHIRRGTVYGEGGGTGTTSLTVDANDLGTTSQSFNATATDQGKFSVGVGYDALRHYSTESYKTPLAGSMGGNNFTLPNTFGVVETSINKGIPAVANLRGTQTLTNWQKSFFHAEDVYSGRENTRLTAGYALDRQWGLQFELNELKQTGSKLMMASSDSNQSWATVAANNTTTLKKGPGGAFPVGTYYTVEAMMMLMNPTNYTTDTTTLSVNWAGDKGHFSAGYFGSLFRDGYNSVSWQTPMVSCGNVSGPNAACTLAAGNATGQVPAGAFPTNILSTAPSNEFHQLNFSGGYELSPGMNLAGSFSRGENTQNESFVNDPNEMQANGLLPQTSLHGLVITQHADAKLTDQYSRDLILSAGVKYNLRDNLTPANIYNFIDLGDKTRTSVNTPMSNKKTQLEVAGDYRIDKLQNLRITAEREQIERWCNDPLSNSATAAAKSVAPAGYYTVNSCVQVPFSNEDKLTVNYRKRTADDVSFNAGYGYAVRSATVNASFYNPMQSNSEGFEATGYRAYFDASRQEQTAKLGADWQANEKLNLGVSGRFTDDLYPDSLLGVQHGNKLSANLDATYNYSDNISWSAYSSFEHRYRTLSNASTINAVTLNGTNVWTNDLLDDSSTLGLNYKHKGMMGGKLTVVSDLTYSMDTTRYSTTQAYSTTCANPAAAGPTCGNLPSIANEMWEFKISGTYQVDKASKVRVGYVYQDLKSNDYYYNAYQTGYTPTSLLPTDQQSPSYTSHSLLAAYIYTF
jgi:MtrB/PioB family decaheme-associated outer membrane protein